MRIKKILTYIMFMLAIIALFLPGFARMQQLKAENDRLVGQLKDMKTRNLELKKDIYKMRTDPVYVESVARDKLKKVRKGEMIYKVN